MQHLEPKEEVEAKAETETEVQQETVAQPEQEAPVEEEASEDENAIEEQETDLHQVIVNGEKIDVDLEEFKSSILVEYCLFRRSSSAFSSLFSIANSSVLRL